MLAHVVSVLREVVDEVVVVSAAELPLPDVQARVVVDREPHLGPLAGIREGLGAICAERAYVTSTDAPYLTPAFARALLAFGTACAPVLDGVIQPLAAVLPRSAESEAARLIASGRRSAHGLLESIGFRPVVAAELPALDALRSLDTPDAYLEAVRSEFPGATARVERRGAETRVAIGTLEQVLARAAPGRELCRAGAIARNYRVSLAGLDDARDARPPIGPDELVRVCEVGG